MDKGDIEARRMDIDMRVVVALRLKKSILSQGHNSIVSNVEMAASAKPHRTAFNWYVARWIWVGP